MGTWFINFALLHIEERDLNELEGMVRGIAIDGRINAAELAGLRRWAEAMQPRLTAAHSDVIERIELVVSDGILDQEERADLLWLIERVRATRKRFSETTKDMQVLHGILAGIATDGVVHAEELRGLRAWLDDAAELKGQWPYDEIDSLVTAALADGRVDLDEQRFLLAFTAQFIERRNDMLTEPVTEDLVKQGICSVQPEVTFNGRRFVVTGHSPRASRAEMHAHIGARGGLPHPNVTKAVDYLVVADTNSVAWAFSCYGRKIEAAMKLRRQGGRIVVVHESDFWDALQDAPVLKGR